ncbi:MAG TPA: hypothetical protein VM166_05340 [Gemmatimonadaceae bacterium]|nr:hypothetical protein [Gemmatimonadaceae bacterium]
MKSTPRRARALVFLFSVAVWTTAHAQQPSTVIVTVVDELSRHGLTNAEIVDVATGQHRFTDEQGQARVSVSAAGTARIRVREIGYQPVERTIDRPTGSNPVVVELKRVAYVISPVRASSARCSIDADSSSRLVSASALAQLQESAEKWARFRRAYPFEAEVERRTAYVNGAPVPSRIDRVKEIYRSDNDEDVYTPGQIFIYRRGSLATEISLLSISMLADQNFWDHHCFVVRGVEPLNGSRAVRLEFSPSSDVKGPDWSGAALLDSATSYLLRVDFHAENLGRNYNIQRLEGFRTFISPSPFVVMPDSSVAAWWKRGPNGKGEWGNPDVAQGLSLMKLTYKKSTPPTVRAVPDSAGKPPS